MPENFYNEKAARGLIERFKIVVGGMATRSLGHGSFGTRFGTGRRSTGQDRAGQGATARGLNAVENLTPRYATAPAGTANNALANRRLQPTPLSRHAVNPGRGSSLDRNTTPSTLPKQSMR
jgi:hypothetical protein